MKKPGRLKQSWATLPLHAQLIIVGAALLATTIFATSYINIKNQTNNAINAIKQDATTLVRNLAVSGAYHILTAQYDALENLLLSSVDFPGIRKIKVSDVHGRPLANVSSMEGNQPQIHFDLTLEVVPEFVESKSTPTMQLNDYRLTVWQPVATSALLGWIKAEYDLQGLQITKRRIIKENMLAAVIALLIDIFVLLLVLKPPLKTLTKATIFAGSLNQKTGKLLAVAPASREIDLLVESLNHASRELLDQKERISENANNLKKSSERLNCSNKQLKDKIHELESFSYSISHDLRAPLRSIDGFSYALLEEYGDRLDEAGKDYLNRVRGNTHRMGQLVDDILNLSRISSYDLKRSAVNLTELSRKTITELKEQDPHRQVDVMIEDSLHASADAKLVQILLSNLINNAWKYTRKSNNPRIEIKSIRRTNNVVFMIKDNGVGFDMKYSGKLFNAFQRLHNNADFEGTGIGLAIVKRIVSRHLGRVWVEAKTGEGASFYFTLNADQSEHKYLTMPKPSQPEQTVYC